MTRWLGPGALALALVGTASVLAFEGDAQACGGCFQPQENPTVVTDHRMLLSVSKDQSTLYDQIKYSGAPSSFGWVLPIAGTATIGLSADIVFQGLDQITQTTIQAPPRNCPPPPSDCATAQATPGAASGSADAGVTVLGQQVVGPYQTVTLQSSDPTALTTWLSGNGFVVPPGIDGVIAAYVSEKFDFLAMKLLPGKGVQDMRPVRVTTTGATVSLPLRMVAAGTGATVGISLWVIAEGRYEPQNFPFFHIDDADIAWDWTTNKSNYTDLRAQKEAAGGGKIWEIESSLAVTESQVQGYAAYGPAENNYDPEKASDGTITKTASQVRDDDFATMFHGIANSPRVTRMRSDVAHAALNADLVMIASADQSVLSNVRVVTKELNEPQCPVYQGCEVVGTAPRDQLTGSGGPNHETSSCATAPRTSEEWMFAGSGFLTLALVKALRRRR